MKNENSSKNYNRKGLIPSEFIKILTTRNVIKLIRKPQKALVVAYIYRILSEHYAACLQRPD
jgi:hypothetical protein